MLLKIRRCSTSSVTSCIPWLVIFLNLYMNFQCQWIQQINMFQISFQLIGMQLNAYLILEGSFAIIVELVWQYVWWSKILIVLSLSNCGTWHIKRYCGLDIKIRIANKKFRKDSQLNFDKLLSVNPVVTLLICWLGPLLVITITVNYLVIRNRNCA